MGGWVGVYAFLKGKAEGSLAMNPESGGPHRPIAALLDSRLDRPDCGGNRGP